MKTWQLLGILLACFILAGCILPPKYPWEFLITGVSWNAMSGSLSNSCFTPYPAGSCSYSNDSQAIIVFPESSNVIDWLNVTVAGSISGAYRAYGCYQSNFTITNGTSSITGITGLCTSESQSGSSSITKMINFSRTILGAPNVITDGVTTLSFTTPNATIYLHVDGSGEALEYYNRLTASSSASYVYLNGTSDPSIPVIVSSTIVPSPAHTNDTLLGYCNGTVEYLDNVSYNFTWYKNDVLNATGTFNSTAQGISRNVGNISNTSLVFGDIWILQCLAYNANGTSSALNSSHNDILGGATANYSSGINGISFRPAHAFAKDVGPVNQTSTTPLYVVNNTKNYTSQIVGKINVSISGFSMKCADTFSPSAASVITTSWSNLSVINASTNGSLWCWGDFSNPQPRSQSFDISIDGVRYQ